MSNGILNVKNVSKLFLNKCGPKDQMSAVSSYKINI